MKALCPGCHEVKKLTKHHFVPSRHGGKKNDIVYLCRDCHDAADALVAETTEETSKEAFLGIIIDFLKGFNPMVRW